MENYAARAQQLRSMIQSEKPLEVVSAPPQIDWTSLQKAEKESKRMI